MKNKKALKKLVQKIVKESIKEGVVQEKKVNAFLKVIRQLPLSKAVFMLSEYKKGLQSELSKHTLVIESPISLSIQQVSKIKNELKSLGKIVKTETKINPELIAGLRVKLGDVIFDDSMNARINQLKGAIIHG